jgi:hypothetical protein
MVISRFPWEIVAQENHSSDYHHRSHRQVLDRFTNRYAELTRRAKAEAVRVCEAGSGISAGPRARVAWRTTKPCSSGSTHVAHMELNVRGPPSETHLTPSPAASRCPAQNSDNLKACATWHAGANRWSATPTRTSSATPAPPNVGTAESTGTWKIARGISDSQKCVNASPKPRPIWWLRLKAALCSSLAS